MIAKKIQRRRITDQQQNSVNPPKTTPVQVLDKNTIPAKSQFPATNNGKVSIKGKEPSKGNKSILEGSRYTVLAKFGKDPKGMATEF